MSRSLSLDEVSDLLIGATILGTGGGGEPKEGLRLLESDLRSGRTLKLESPMDLDPESFIVCSYSCGAISAPGKKRDANALDINERITKRGLEAMRREIGGKISAVIPAEMGGQNTAVAIHAAALLGLPAIDGDQAGRAAPEVSQSTYQVHEVKASPAVVSDALEDLVVILDYVNIEQYETIARNIAVLGGGHALVIDSPVKAKEVPKLAILGTVTRAITLGETVRKANEKHDNAIENLINFLGGYEIFHGRVDAVNLKETAGFLIGTITFNGFGEWRGRNAKVWVKNENIVAWRDETLIASAPDLIMIVDKAGYGITNSNMKKGLEVAIIGGKAADVWRTPKGIELFGPKHFGFKFNYKPIEQLIKSG